MDTSFPPSPQWHQPHSACLCALDEVTGWLLYSLNNSIHVLSPFTLKYRGILENGHTARINAIASRTSSSLDLTTQDSGKASSVALRSFGGHTIVNESSISAGTEHPSPSPSSTGQDDDSKPQKALVASVGDDLKVVCWDVSTMKMVASTKKNHQKPIKAVEWTSDGKYIVSGDKGGVVAVWCPFQGKTNKKTLPDKSSISCLSASPAHADTVAIGLDGGDILVCQVNLTYIVVLRRLHGHGEKIQSLSWQPPSGLQDQGYTLLASGSADQTIRVWDVEQESSVKVYKIPELDKKLAPYQRSKLWVPVGWASKGHEIVSCTSRGTMVRWPLKGDPGNYSKIVQGKLHSRGVFQLMMWPSGTFAFTISMDRKIIAWDVDNSQGVAQIECIGGNVYSLDIGVLDPARIVMGLGNEAIKVWNTLSEDEPYESITIERLQSRVRAVKWHPAEEEQLCFGLENGKIGMIEHILSGTGHRQQKQGKRGKHGAPGKGKIGQKQTIFQSYHEGTIVSMTWCTPKALEAPVPELFDLSLRDSTFCVISCGSEGKILVTDSSKPANKSLDLEVVIQRQNTAWYESCRVIKGVYAPLRRDFAIHPNEDLLAIGNDDGSVEVFELKYFKLVYVYQGHRRRVNRVKWNWSGAGADGESEASDVASYLLASGSDDGALAIHRLERFSAKAVVERRQREKQLVAESQHGDSAAAADTDTILPTRRVYAYFSYHSKGISDMAWSPHGSGDKTTVGLQKIVTASYDGQAIVYQLQLDERTEESTLSIEADIIGDAKEASPLTKKLTGTVPAPRQHKPLACFNHHEGQILSVQWSMSDVDRIYSGGNDWRLCLWDWRPYELSDLQLESLKRVGSSSSPQYDAKVSKNVPAAAAVKHLSTVDDQDVVLDGEEQMGVSIALQEYPERRLDGPQPMVTAQNEGDADDAPSSVKREGDASLHREPGPAKRAKTGQSRSITSPSRPSTGHPTASSKSAPSLNPIKGLNLFPLSSAGFRFHSKEQIHLEIIRLTRNLYCRRIGQGGILTNEEEHEAARKSWRAMRDFFEKSGEEAGVVLSRILGKDVDELNFGDDDGDDDDGDNDSLFDQTPETDLIGSNPRVDGTDRQDVAIELDLGRSRRSKISIVDTDDSGAPSGDLIFYGSRESVKALAEMEAEQVTKGHSGNVQVQYHSNIFAVGSGMGVTTAPVYKQKDATSQSKSKKAGQLGQIPVSYWMGDVPKVLNILSSLPETELGVQDWIGIALAPMGGVQAWKEAMSRTAAKFESRDEVHAAVLCYLGIGRVFEAVDAYRKQEMYREALTLLRIRLWEDEDGEEEESGVDRESNGYDMDEQSDEQVLQRGSNRSHDEENEPDLAGQEPQERPSAASKDLTRLHIQILTEWGQYLERRNFYEQACKCQLTLAAVLRRSGRWNSTLGSMTNKAERLLQATPTVGLQTLARRGDVATLRVVAGLAILLEDPARQERISRYESALAHQKKQGS